jgi:hypothetical protein
MALPGLSEALSARAMAPRLQGMLAPDWELLAGSPGKVLITPGEGASLQYRLELRRRGTGETAERLVGGWLSLTAQAAERRLADTGPLVDRLDGREDLHAFARPAVLVRELRLVLHAFPLDPLLPGLVVATDAEALVGMLGPVLTSSVPGLLLRDCSAQLVRYRQGSCVLRYELAWHLESSRRGLKQVLYGRVYGDDRGRLVGQVLTALRTPPNGQAALPFLVPRFQAYLPDLRLALVEAVPGSPLLPALLRRRPGVPVPPADAGPGPAEAVAACARIAAALHRSSVPVGPPRTLAEEIDGTLASVERLAPLAPALAASLHRRLRALGDVALDPAEPLGVAHGDFSPRHVLFDGPTTSLVRFDTVCLGEPALDLGQFTAHLAASAPAPADLARAVRDGAEDLGSVFLREYLRQSGSGDPDALLARVAAHRTVALARLAVRKWCQLKPERLRPVLALLEEPQRSRVP